MGIYSDVKMDSQSLLLMAKDPTLSFILVSFSMRATGSSLSYTVAYF